MSNPYTLTFGKEPSQQISRLFQANDIIEAFTEEEPSNQVFVITGVRGSGKTVLMTEISNKLAEDSNWVTVELNPTSDMLKSLGAKLYSNNSVADIFRNLDISLGLFGVDIKVKKQNQIIDMETAIEKMMESLKKHNKRLLITVDEVTNTDYIKTFVSAFQILIRKGAPIFLLMTGLYENISELQNEKNLTFLFRAPKSVMKPLNINSVAKNYEKVLGVTAEQAADMAKFTCGYSYAFQVLGYLTYANQGDYNGVLDDYAQYLEEYVYDKIWSELSAKDKQLAIGIANTKSGKINEIREKLNMTTNEFNPYRKRLIKKGIINGDSRGYVKFTLPLFDKFVLANDGWL